MPTRPSLAALRRIALGPGLIVVAVTAGLALGGRAAGRWVMDRIVGAKFDDVSHIDTATAAARLAGPAPPLLLDVRTAEEYAVSHLPGARRLGHVPGARHLDWRFAFDDHGKLRNKAVLRAGFEQAGVAFDRPAGAYCTGGIRSGFAYLLLRWLDHPAPANYDGSWWAWAADGARPVAR
ncbi:MAG: hypothetical protein KC613_13355 [Myxococcales bacterium]|nr:hypothetical protein [Myxococcales bacterium]